MQSTTQTPSNGTPVRTQDPQHLITWASRLWDARVLRTPIPPLTSASPGLPALQSLEDAYAVSRRNFERRLAQPGVRSIGRKIGLTSKAVQKQLGVEQPDFGFLTNDMLLPTGSTLKRGSLIQGRAEGEIAFELATDLSTGTDPITPEQVRKATRRVFPCIEIIDSRIADWRIRVEDTVADNASSAFFVLGQPTELGDRDLRGVAMTLRLGDAIASTGTGAACLEDPLNAVAWLATTLGQLGDGLKAGDLVLSGAFGPVVPLREGAHCSVEFDSGFGSAEFRYGP